MYLKTLLLLLFLPAASTALRGGEDASRPPVRKPPRFARILDAEGQPLYRIYPLRNGTCRVKGAHAFMDNADDERGYDYALWVWLVLGGEKPFLIDAGLEDVAHMNEIAGKVFDHPIEQRPDETSDPE